MKADKEEMRRAVYDGVLEESTVSEEKIFEGRVFTVRKLYVELPDGSSGSREIISHRGGAAIVPVDSEGNVYLVEQYRVATGKTLLEIPAGKLEESENPLECAERELTEETGLKAESIVPLTAYYPTPGYSSEKIYVYLAGGLSQHAPCRDEGEFLHVVKIPFAEAYKMVAEGQIEDSKTVVGILMAKEIL